ALEFRQPRARFGADAVEERDAAGFEPALVAGAGIEERIDRVAQRCLRRAALTALVGLLEQRPRTQAGHLVVQREGRVGTITPLLQDAPANVERLGLVHAGVDEPGRDRRVEGLAQCATPTATPLAPH